MSEAFREISLHHQALYKDPNDVKMFYEKLRSFQHIDFHSSVLYSSNIWRYITLLINDSNFYIKIYIIYI